MLIKYKKLHPYAKAPWKGNATDAGWDLHASETIEIPAGASVTIKTDISFEMPDDCVGLIWPRSGLAVTRGVDVFAGVVDSGYRGEVKVCLYNSGRNVVGINKGDRIAQILFHNLPLVAMEEADALSRTDRGDGGFGSSGR